MYFLYNLALRLASVLLLPWIAYWRMRGRLPGLGQRLGWFSWTPFPPGTPTIWIHAVSVGEVKAAAALIGKIGSRIPNVHFVVTSSTGAGWNAARQLLNPSDQVLFPPIDLISVCRIFLRRIGPHAVIVLETELWPNLFRECKRYGAVLLLANGRISDRTFPRYRASRLLWRRVLEQPDALFVQSSAEAERFADLGAPPEKLHVAGNLKFASQPAPSALISALRETFRDSQDSSTGPVIIAGSTMPGEEKYLLEAFQELLPEFPRLWMVLAPRHPNRFAAVAEQVQASGVPVQLRSQWSAPFRPVLPGILILDSIGELGAMYELATVAFVGGTLVPTGGHNILEPASFARPIVIGPSMSNFQEIARDFLQDAGLESIPNVDNIGIGSIIQVPDPSKLVPVFRFLFRNPAFRDRLGETARDCWKRNLSGVVPIVDELQRLLALRTNAGKQQENIQQREIVGAGKME